MISRDKEIDVNMKGDACVEEFTIDPVEHFIA